MTRKPKSRGLPALPADDLVLHSGQLNGVHLEKQDDDCWWLAFDLTDGRRITVLFTAPDLCVFQQIEDPPRGTK